MKKITLLFILICICLVGCDNRNKYRRWKRQTVDGHLWMTWNNYNMGRIAHHPECPCLKK